MSIGLVPAELVGVEAVGFPQWQYDPVDQGRNIAALSGTIRVAEDATSGYLVLRDQPLDTVAALVRSPQGDDDQVLAADSAWDGLSGALVFYAGYALGVVVQHRRQQGAASVRLMPIDRIAAGVDAGSRAVAAALGLPKAEQLPVVNDAGSLATLDGLADWLAHGDFPLVTDMNAYQLGATESDYGHANDHGQHDSYVARRIDPELRAALQPQRFVLLVGPSKVGKTRTAFEAVAARWPQARLAVPTVKGLGQLAVHPRLKNRSEPVVVWLNDIDRYLVGENPLTLALLARLTDSSGPIIVIATLRKEARDRLRRATGELPNDARDLLGAAIQFELASTAQDPQEQEAAQRAYPKEDLARIGLAEHLVNAPALLEAYRDAKDARPLGLPAGPGGSGLVPGRYDPTRYRNPDLLDLLKKAAWADTPLRGSPTRPSARRSAGPPPRWRARTRRPAPHLSAGG